MPGVQHADIDHTGLTGVGSGSLDTILAASSGEDTADALTGAAAPDAGNPFATMADLTVGGSGALAAHPLPLDSVAIDGTYGDDFTGASLSGSWTRRNFTAVETFQLGPGATWMRIPLAGRSAGDGYFRTAPGGNWEFACAIVPYFFDSSDPSVLFGLAVVDSAGTGVWVTNGNGTPRAVDLLSVTTYSTYGGSYVEAGLPSSAPNVTYLPVGAYAQQHKVWLRLRKSGTSYFGSFSANGELWGPESGALTWTGTVDRVGLLLGPLTSATLTNAYIDVDWFNKVA